MDMDTVLNVWLDNKLIGSLQRIGRVHMTFQYSDSWLNCNDAFPISLSLPLQETAFSTDQSKAFFDNLLPEQGTRHRVARSLQVSEKNAYGLLYEIGGECAGALSVRAQDNPPEKMAYQSINKSELEKLIHTLPSRPLLAGGDGVRLSLAGAQPKIALVAGGGAYYLPLNGSPSTHILKPAIPDLQESVENEVFCMSLARAAGLPVPRVAITDTHPRALIVERYDRAIRHDQVLRIHQEDFCQALGLPSELKYEREGGASLADCFSVLDHCHDPVKEKNTLFKWVVVNFLIGNADAHAKNISLLYDSPPKPRLAPFYDMLSTAVYEGLAVRLSMRVGGRYDPKFVQRRHWVEAGTLAGLDELSTIECVRNQCNNVKTLADSVAEAFVRRYKESAIVDKIVEDTKKRCKNTLARLFV